MWQWFCIINLGKYITVSSTTWCPNTEENTERIGLDRLCIKNSKYGLKKLKLFLSLLKDDSPADYSNISVKIISDNLGMPCISQIKGIENQNFQNFINALSPYCDMDINILEFESIIDKIEEISPEAFEAFKSTLVNYTEKGYKVYENVLDK